MDLIDFRSRTAAQRRERTYRHLIQTALVLLAEQGMTGSLIDDLIKLAGVSRGTFYNYFRSPDELLEAVSTTISSELVRLVDPVVLAQPDPAARVCCGIRLCLQAGKENPALAAFISRGGPAALHQSGQLAHSLYRDLNDGIQAGLFTVQDVGLAFDLVIGPVLATYHQLAASTTQAGHIDALAAAVLVGLGVKRSTATRLSKLPLPKIAWNSEAFPLQENTPTRKRSQ